MGGCDRLGVVGDPAGDAGAADRQAISGGRGRRLPLAVCRAWVDADFRARLLVDATGAAASLGFVVYSVLLDNWVFIVTNGLILLTAVVGFVLQKTRGRMDAALTDDPRGR